MHLVYLVLSYLLLFSDLIFSYLIVFPLFVLLSFEQGPVDVGVLESHISPGISELGGGGSGVTAGGVSLSPVPQQWAMQGQLGYGGMAPVGREGRLVSRRQSTPSACACVLTTFSFLDA